MILSTNWFVSFKEENWGIKTMKQIHLESCEVWMWKEIRPEHSAFICTHQASAKRALMRQQLCKMQRRWKKHQEYLVDNGI